MQFNILFVAAILVDLSLANTYDIKLYKDASCKGTVGVKCSKVAARACCAQKSSDKKKGDTWSLSTSAGYVESGSGKANADDQIKIYTGSTSDGCNMVIDQSTTCASHNTKEVTGAAVFVVINHKSRFRRDQPPQPKGKTVEPSEYFYEDGTTEYTLPIKSDKGAKYAKMTSETEQVNFLRKFGKRSLLV